MTRGCEASVHEGERYGGGLLYCGWCKVSGILVRNVVGLSIAGDCCGACDVLINKGYRLKAWWFLVVVVEIYRRYIVCKHSVTRI